MLTRLNWSANRVLATSIAVIFLLLLYAVFLFTLPPAKLLTVLSLDTEFIRYRVVAPEFASMQLSGMRMRTEESGDLCVNAAVTPAAGAWVEYRHGSRYFRIIIDPPDGGGVAAYLQTQDSASRPLTGSVIFSSAECE